MEGAQAIWMAQFLLIVWSTTTRDTSSLGLLVDKLAEITSEIIAFSFPHQSSFAASHLRSAQWSDEMVSVSPHFEGSLQGLTLIFRSKSSIRLVSLRLENGHKRRSKTRWFRSLHGADGNAPPGSLLSWLGRMNCNWKRMKKSSTSGFFYHFVVTFPLWGDGVTEGRPKERRKNGQVEVARRASRLSFQSNAI